MDKERIDNKREVNDELLIDVVNREIKMRKESIVEFEKGNREDLIAQYNDEINILQATRLGMKRAVEELSLTADIVLTDGNMTIDIAHKQKSIIKHIHFVIVPAVEIIMLK